jgi:hypothetical protein
MSDASTVATTGVNVAIDLIPVGEIGIFEPLNSTALRNRAANSIRGVPHKKQCACRHVHGRTDYFEFYELLGGVAAGFSSGVPEHAVVLSPS